MQHCLFCPSSVCEPVCVICHTRMSSMCRILAAVMPCQLAFQFWVFDMDCLCKMCTHLSPLCRLEVLRQTLRLQTCNWTHLTQYTFLYRLGVLIEVNCETDFVARGAKFKELVQDLAMQAAASSSAIVVNASDVPADEMEKERAIEMGKEDIQSKPEAIRWVSPLDAFALCAHWLVALFKDCVSNVSCFWSANSKVWSEFDQLKLTGHVC